MSKIPRFKDRESEAEYWDTHSITEHLDELKEVEVEVKRPLNHVLSVRVDGEDLRRMEALAKAWGVGTTTVARMLLHETLQDMERREERRPGKLPAVRERVEEYRAGTAGPDFDQADSLLLTSARIDSIAEAAGEAVRRMLRQASSPPASPRPRASRSKTRSPLEDKKRNRGLP